MRVYEVMDCDGRWALGLFASVEVARRSLRVSWHKYENVQVVYDGRQFHVTADGWGGVVRKYPVIERDVVTEPEHL